MAEETKKAEKVDFFKDKSKNEFASWIDKQVSEHPVVKAHHGHWKELIEWEDGNQFGIWDDTARAVVPVKFEVREKRIVINLMKPLNETLEGKIDFNHKIVGTPNSGEMKDIRGAQVSTKLIDYNDAINDVEELYEDAKYDLLRPGISCIKWYWDKAHYATLQKSDQPNGVRGATGEVIGEIVSIFNIRPDPTAKTRKKCQWIVEVKEVTKEELKRVYKVKDDWFEDKAVSKKTKKAGTETKAALINKYKGMHEELSEKDKDAETYIVKEFWDRPSSLYPDGRFIVTSEGDVLDARKNPSPDGDLPYFFFVYKKKGNSFWPRGPLHYIQGIQREFNRMISIQSEHIESWRPKMSVGKGAVKRAGAFTVDSFEMVEVDYSRGEPKAIHMPELSPQVTLYRDFLEGAVASVSNVHEVSYARLPQYASRAPASLYSMMLEQENIKLTPMVKRINKTLREMAMFRLKLMDKHYTAKRMVKVVGQHKEATIEYFDRTDLSQNYDVRLEIGVSLHQSPTIQTQLLIQLWREGILTEQDRVKVLRTINLGTAEHEIRRDMADTERALRENQSFIDDTYEAKRQDRGVTVYWNDDHELHLDYHTNFIKSEEAQRWDDDKWRAFDIHIYEHFRWLSFVRKAMAGQLAPPTTKPKRAPGMEGYSTETGEPMIEGAMGKQPGSVL